MDTMNILMYSGFLVICQMLYPILGWIARKHFTDRIKRENFVLVAFLVVCICSICVSIELSTYHRIDAFINGAGGYIFLLIALGPILYAESILRKFDNLRPKEK